MELSSHAADSRAQTFIDALREAESTRRCEPLTRLFTDDASLFSVAFHHEPLNGGSAARQFWDSYLRQFKAVQSRFLRVLDCGDDAALEWVSTVEGRDGRRFEYRGVSVLGFEGEKIKSFATYFDTARFVH